MTREEAIAYGKASISWNKFSKGMKMYQFIEMAIKALSQEPCDETVSLKAVMEVIKAHMDGEDKNTKAVLSDVMESVNELETLVQEPYDDAVSREKVLEMITDFATLELYIDKHNHVTFEPIEKLIKSLPSVTQKSGKWILLDECANSGYYCSRCQKKLVKEGWSNTVKKIKFCPNCGAEMESEE